MSQAVPLEPPRRLLSIEVDGEEVRVPEGATILDACRSQGVDTPTLCFADNLTPVNACRVCVVEVEGASDSDLRTLYSNLYRLNLYPNSQFENTGTAEAPRHQYASPVSPKSGSATATTTNAPVKDGKIYVLEVNPRASRTVPFVAKVIGIPFAKMFSFTEPLGPPSPLAPLSETRTTIVFSRWPVSSR